MTATRERNAVLFFVVPALHKFVVLGDRGIHEKVGPEFWYGVASGLTGKFRQGDLTGGIVAGIEAVGDELARHFPPLETDMNQLPDEVDDQRQG
jgi:uncharacterized membrane protein